MAYQVEQLIKDKGKPVYVFSDDTVTKALSLMIDHDYSQLPVLERDERYDNVVGIITYEGILRGVRNFGAKIEDLRVRDVMVQPQTCSVEDDLFDILDRLRDTNAVLVLHSMAPELVGIITSYDTTQYFRDRTEDLMRVEEVESIIKELIRAAYIDQDGKLNDANLNNAIAMVLPKPSEGSNGSDKPKPFEKLTLHDYNNLLLLPKTWPFFEPILCVKRDFVRPLLSGILQTRNDLAHFRADEITPEQRDQLKFGVDWLRLRHQEYQARLEKERNDLLAERIQSGEIKVETIVDQPETTPSAAETGDQSGATDYSVADSATGGGRWSAFADWLQSQPGRIDEVRLTFAEVEEITKAPLPASARTYRAWWANEATGHSQSQQWLAAGWRTSYINLVEGRVTFSRIREREKAYIDFFRKLLDDLRKNSGLPVKDINPEGNSWIVIQKVPRHKGAAGLFSFSFTRDKQFRVELYLDLGSVEKTKAAFDSLCSQRASIESQTGPIEWERLATKRASRLAQYHDGQVTDDSNHDELRKWAVETMIKFYNALAEPAEKAILEARQA
jgi:CBS domain-containing protein